MSWRLPNGRVVNDPIPEDEAVARSKGWVPLDEWKSEEQAKASPGTMPSPGSFADANPDPQAMLLGALPMGGAMLGGITGGLAGLPAAGIGAGPGAVGGAAVGGASGELLRQLLAIRMGRNDLAPQSGIQGAMGVLGQSALAAGGEGAGIALAAGSRSLGRALMNDALRTSPTLAKRSLNPSIAEDARMPSPVDLMARERIATGRGIGGRGGSEEAFRRKMASMGERDVVLSEMGMRGKTYTTRDIVNAARPRIDKLRARAAEQADEDAIDEVLNEARAFGFEPGAGGKAGTFKPLTPEELQARKTTWDKKASESYTEQTRTGARGRGKAASSTFAQETYRALADAARRALEGGAAAVSKPGANRLMAANRRTAEMALLQEALRNAEVRPITLNPLGQHINAQFLLEHPDMLSRLGLGLTHPAMLQLLQQAPLGAWAGTQALNAGNR